MSGMARTLTKDSIRALNPCWPSNDLEEALSEVQDGQDGRVPLYEVVAHAIMFGDLRFGSGMKDAHWVLRSFISMVGPGSVRSCLLFTYWQDHFPCFGVNIWEFCDEVQRAYEMGFNSTGG